MTPVRLDTFPLPSRLVNEENGALGEPDDLPGLATEHHPLKGAHADGPNDYAIHPFPLCYLHYRLMRFVTFHNPPLAADPTI